MQLGCLNVLVNGCDDCVFQVPKWFALSSGRQEDSWNRARKTKPLFLQITCIWMPSTGMALPHLSCSIAFVNSGSVGDSPNYNLVVVGCDPWQSPEAHDWQLKSTYIWSEQSLGWCLSACSPVDVDISADLGSSQSLSTICFYSIVASLKSFAHLVKSTFQTRAEWATCS